MTAVSCRRSLTSAHWQALAHGITAIGTKDTSFNRKKFKSGTGMYKDLILYYKEFLAFVEEFVLVHPTPLRMYLWPALTVVESGLYDEKANLDEQLSRSRTTASVELSGRHLLIPQDTREEEERLSDLDRSIETLQRIKDTYFEDKDHLSYQEMLEGFEMELFGGLFSVSDAPEYATSGHRKQSRSASISEFLTRKKREIFATLGSSASRAEDLPKIAEEEEDDVDVASLSHSSAAMGLRGRALGGKRSPRTRQRETVSLLSSDEEEETSHDHREQVRRDVPRARKLGLWGSRDRSYDGDTEMASPVNPVPGYSGLVTVTAEVHRSRPSVSSETSPYADGSRKSPAATGDLSPVRRPNSTSDAPMRTVGAPSKLGPRKLSDTLLIPSSSALSSTPRWPSDSHLTPEDPRGPSPDRPRGPSPDKPRGPSPILISQRVSKAGSLDEAGNRRPLLLVRSNAVVEESPTTTPETQPYRDISADVAMIESPTSGQRRPLLPGDREVEQRQLSPSALSQQRQLGQEGRQQQGQERGGVQFSRALEQALQELDKGAEA